MSLKIGETRSNEHYTISRSFGRVDFALNSGSLNDIGLAVETYLSHTVGEEHGEFISANSPVSDIDLAGVLARASYMRLDTANLAFIGTFALLVNEHILSLNPTAIGLFEKVVDKITGIIETESSLFSESFDGEQKR